MDFWFIFKKVIAIGLTPVSITLELVIIGVILVGFSRKASRVKPHPRWLWFKGVSGDLGGFLIWGAALFLYLCSTGAVASGLSGLLESKHPALESVETSPDYIVVLPGGHRYASDKTEISSIRRKTFVRLMKGIEYWRQFPESTLVFSGLPAEVGPMSDISMGLGVPVDKIFKEVEARDTKDHPRYLKKLLSGKPFLLVTSGNHMPRSVALFEGQGLVPTPVATDLHHSPGKFFSIKNFVPQGRHVLTTDEAFHEYLGMGWAALRSQVKERQEARAAFQKAGAAL